VGIQWNLPTKLELNGIANKMRNDEKIRKHQIWVIEAAINFEYGSGLG
jgi:hypothetical protein